MGLVERMNQSLITMIRAHVADSGEEWDKALPSVIFAYRAAVHAALRDSPFHLVFNRDPVLPVDLLLQNNSEPIDTDDRYIWQMARDFQHSWELARTNLLTSQKELKTVYDRKARADRVRVGDVVLKRIHLHATGELCKFAPKFAAGYRVISLDSPNVTIVYMSQPRTDPNVIHVNDVKIDLVKIDRYDLDPQVTAFNSK